MSRVSLLPIDAALAKALASGEKTFAEAYGAGLDGIAPLATQVVEQTLAMLEATPRPDPWGGYLAVVRDQEVVVGTCAFKEGQAPDGSVEIAYFTFPPFEGQGIATAMARALIELALGGRATAVVAHTQPTHNASTRVLEKLAFSLEGEAEDAQDGKVWRWVRSLEFATSEAALPANLAPIGGGAPAPRRVSLVPVEAELLAALETADEEKLQEYGIRLEGELEGVSDGASEWVSEGAFEWVRAVAGELVGAIEDRPRAAPWIGYLGVDEESMLIVGSCGFRDAPDAQGTVEILHVLTLPGLEGRGFATAMVRALFAVAVAEKRVKRVVVYTLPETSSLTSIVTRAGMRFQGLVRLAGEDPLWCWDWEPKRRG